VWAIMAVETRGTDLRIASRDLFERHVFHRGNEGKFAKKAPDLSNPDAGGYGPVG